MFCPGRGRHRQNTSQPSQTKLTAWPSQVRRCRCPLIPGSAGVPAGQWENLTACPTQTNPSVASRYARSRRGRQRSQEAGQWENLTACPTQTKPSVASQYARSRRGRQRSQEGCRGRSSLPAGSICPLSFKPVHALAALPGSGRHRQQQFRSRGWKGSLPMSRPEQRRHRQKASQPPRSGLTARLDQVRRHQKTPSNLKQNPRQLTLTASR
jgi:hypothetical protein